MSSQTNSQCAFASSGILVRGYSLSCVRTAEFERCPHTPKFVDSCHDFQLPDAPVSIVNVDKIRRTLTDDLARLVFNVKPKNFPDCLEVPPIPAVEKVQPQGTLTNAYVRITAPPATFSKPPQSITPIAYYEQQIIHPFLECLFQGKNCQIKAKKVSHRKPENLKDLTTFTSSTHRKCTKGQLTFKDTRNSQLRRQFAREHHGDHSEKTGKSLYRSSPAKRILPVLRRFLQRNLPKADEGHDPHMLHSFVPLNSIDFRIRLRNEFDKSVNGKDKTVFPDIVRRVLRTRRLKNLSRLLLRDSDAEKAFDLAEMQFFVDEPEEEKLNRLQQEITGELNRSSIKGLPEDAGRRTVMGFEDARQRCRHCQQLVRHYTGVDQYNQLQRLRLLSERQEEIQRRVEVENTLQNDGTINAENDSKNERKNSVVNVVGTKAHLSAPRDDLGDTGSEKSAEQEDVSVAKRLGENQLAATGASGVTKKLERLKTAAGNKDRKAENAKKLADLQSGPVTSGKSQIMSSGKETSTPKESLLQALRNKMGVLPAYAEEPPWLVTSSEKQDSTRVNQINESNGNYTWPKPTDFNPAEIPSMVINDTIAKKMESVKRILCDVYGDRKLDIRRSSGNNGDEDAVRSVPLRNERSEANSRPLLEESAACGLPAKNNYAWQMSSIKELHELVQERWQYYDSCIDYLESLMPATGSETILAKLQQLHAVPPAATTRDFAERSRKEQMCRLTETIDKLSEDTTTETDETAVFRAKLSEQILRLQLVKHHAAQRAENIIQTRQELYHRRLTNDLHLAIYGSDQQKTATPTDCASESENRQTLELSPPLSPRRRSSLLRRPTDATTGEPDDDGGSVSNGGSKRGGKMSEKKEKGGKKAAAAAAKHDSRKAKGLDGKGASHASLDSSSNKRLLKT